MNPNSEKIAVVGMACRFPGANDLDEFWKNLIEAKETIKYFTDEELSGFEVNYQELKNNPKFVKARGVLDNVDKFDEEFFGMTPKEASETDPQHRVWLETAWEAMENAGCDTFKYPGSIGVFAGGFLNTYLLNNILRDPVKYENFIRLRTKESYDVMVGNDVAFIPTKTAYHFNLRGPAINVQTACSTSLVAISQACQSLFSFESDMCIAGGICIITPQESGYIHEEGAIPSSDGHCRPFDIKGEGTVFSNGVGVVVLKRLDDALKDRDRIYSVVRGWALNNDGKNKVSYFAPSVEGQSEAIAMAQSFAGVHPEEIGYIETHGTATHLGDPIEITSLKKAFAKGTQKKQFCGIGSVKSNIGHTDAAAGVASFIKTSLAAYNRVIPPSINFTQPNKYIKFEKTPFYVLDKIKKWEEGKPLIMGISSFGIGGTNAHVIVEEPPRIEKTTPGNQEFPELVVLSARNEEALKKRKQELIDFLEKNPETNIRDISYTLSKGRNHMPYRSFSIASELSDINRQDSFKDGKADEMISKIAFMFPGHGSQYSSMGRDLYNTNQVFRQTVDRCFEITKSETGEDFSKLLFANETGESGDSKLSEIEFAQALLFIVEYGLVKVLESLDIHPDYLIGYSTGEFVAASVAGVFDLQSALKIVIRRGQLMQKMNTGKMLAVRAGIEDLQKLATNDFEIAAENSDKLCTISCKTENYPEIIKLLEEQKIPYTELNVSHAFHSASFDPILDEFSTYVDNFKREDPEIPVVSCLTGEYINSGEAFSGSYWAEQLREMVHFRKSINLINEHNNVVFLEVGPNTHLSSMIRENQDIDDKRVLIPTLGKPDNRSENYRIMDAAGNLFNIGFDPVISSWDENNQPSKITLPTYPFKRNRHWIDFEYPVYSKK